ncbi:MAG TPA: ribosome biogenesis GTP-binding protein YihA/YsxC [Candidatus Gastranaerophilales bacterium]|nr:ribosome biogenesis GTP-binding protein YihA/YsxC [Candidatus Gastranaerophilales bacterium]
MIKVIKAEFLISCPALKNCPQYNLPEIALIGRSNVGKSSFINTVAGRKQLAKTSNTPGKTRLINLYNLQEKVIIADLPGYGYARVSKKELALWEKNLEEYLLKRESLKFVIQFIDARHEAQKNDLQMKEWLDHNKIKTVTLATKSDTLSKNKACGSIKSLSETLNTEIIEFSAKTGAGKEKILKLIFED